MLSVKALSCVFMLLALFHASFAERRVERHHRRQSSSAPVSNTTLEPVIPPSVNTGVLSILAPSTSLTLAWAGTPGTGNSSSPQRLLKRDTSVYSQANFTFKLPSVPLDHSDFISGISCSGGSLTATLSSTAFPYAKQQWAKAGTLLFITSADGCGTDGSNYYFQASSIAFNTAASTFTATGSAEAIKSVAAHMSLVWGAAPASAVKRSIDKRDAFEPLPLRRRATLSYTVDWGYWLEDEDELGTDDTAPWPEAALLVSYGTEGGEPDDSYEEGQIATTGGHSKRTPKMEDLVQRDLSYGLNLWCVHCGFGGDVTFYGTIDFDFLEFEFTTIQCGMDADISAGLSLGMEAFVDYSKDWTYNIATVELGGFGIDDILSVGPFVSVGLSATADISATGQLLIGAEVDWADVSVLMDLLNPDNSYVTLGSPTFTKTLNVSGELDMSVTLGIPLGLGVGLEVLGDEVVSAQIVDTPSIVAEGQFQVSAEVSDNGTITSEVNGGCYGIAWDIHFQNELALVLSADDIISTSWDIIPIETSSPIAEGCIGYVNDGTGTGSGEGSPGENGGGTGLEGSNNSGSDAGTTTTSSSSSKSSSKSTLSMASKTTSVKSTSTPTTPTKPATTAKPVTTSKPTTTKKSTKKGKR